MQVLQPGSTTTSLVNTPNISAANDVLQNSPITISTPAPAGDELLAPDEPLELNPASGTEVTSLFKGIWDFLTVVFGREPATVSAKNDYQYAYPPPTGDLNEESSGNQVIDYGYDARNCLTSTTYGGWEELLTATTRSATT